MPRFIERACGLLADKLRRAREAGAGQLLGRDPTGPSGLGLPPHVLLGSNEVATAREEVFGPVITVIRAEGEEDALHIANDTEYGLSSAVLTRDMDRGAQFARRVEAGMGIGRFGGRWAVDKFTTHRWLSVQREPRAGSRSEGLP